MASIVVTDDDIMNMTLDEVSPAPQVAQRATKPRKSKQGGSIEVKRMGVTVDMVATVEDAKWAKGAGYEVFAHNGHIKSRVAGNPFASTPGNHPRRRS